MPTLYSRVNETGNRDRILEWCKFRLWLVHWIDPRSIEHIFVYPMHWIDPLISFFRLSVCVSVNRSVVKRLRPQFFTDFHQILHAAQKCGRFDACCLWDKLEVVCRF